MRFIQLTALLTVTLFSIAAGQASAQTDSAVQAGKVARTMKDVRFVVLHTPGPNWLPGKSLFEQPGVREHVEHYRRFLEAGKLELGGPHLDGKAGGMMIPSAGVTEDEVVAYAAQDPAVRGGLLLAEVRPWLVGMSR